MSKSNTPPRVLDRIKKAKENNFKSLNLSFEDLQYIPDEIYDLKELELLDLTGNNIKEISSQLSLLNNLKEVNIVGNSLEVIADIYGLVLDYDVFKRHEEKLSKNNIVGLRFNKGNLTFLKSLSEYENLQKLDLSGCNLKKLPEHLSRLTNLTELDVSHNQLQKLPEHLCRLTKLTYLNICNNQLQELPEDICQLTKLTHLFIWENQLKELPKHLSLLNNLTYLNVGGNQLKELPEHLSHLSNLTNLLVWGNQLKELPEHLSRLTNLTSLGVWSNQLQELPEHLSRLTNLTSLDVSDNQLQELPEYLSHLTNLTNLDVSDNKLKELPEYISQLPNLIYINVEGNPLVKPPLEVAVEGIDAIRNYYRQIKEEGLDYIYEAKLLIVGEGESGKTSLAKKIENPAYKLQPDQGTTKGIDVIKWSFETDESKTFRVNIWDFGGQQIYHETHQFFLTKRSLYILVTDSRKEDTDFYYWLNVVELLSDNSPVLIVKNEKFDRKVDMNEPVLREEFGNFKESFPTNLNDNRGLPAIIDSIKHYVLKLPQVGQPLPKTWNVVRTVLEKESEKKDYITLDEYFAICQDNGFTQEKDKLQLSDYLHDLGVVLHFQDDPILRKIVILNPIWGTDAVYKILDHRKLIDKKGRFSFADLKEFWDEPEYQSKHLELLQLMKNFRLCYEIPFKKDEYIAPQLLDKEKPVYDWDEKENLRLKYKYEFMPKGILTRFIVRMHEYIADQRLVWREGIVLEHDGCRGEIIEHHIKREISIRVSGRSRKDLLTNIMFILDDIHRGYSKLKNDKLIPCNCDECENCEKPSFHNYSKLLELMTKRSDTLCIESGEMVSIFNLVDDFSRIEKTIQKALNEKLKDIETNPIHFNIDQIEKLSLFSEDNINVHRKQSSIINSNISAPVTIADDIKDSFNTINNSKMDDGLKESLKELLKEVSDLKGKSPEGTADDVQLITRDTEDLIKESSSSKPRKKRISQYLDDIKETATKVGETALPIMSIIAKISEYVEKVF